MVEEEIKSLREVICLYKGRRLIIHLTYFLFCCLGLYIFWMLFKNGNIFIFPDDYSGLNLLAIVFSFFVLFIGIGFLALHILNYIHYLIDKRKIKNWIKVHPNDKRNDGLLWASYGDYWGIWGMGINRKSIMGYNNE